MNTEPGPMMLLMLDAAAKSAAVLLLAGAAALLMRRAAAATRHMTHLLAVVACLLMPLLCAALPGWQILPHWFDAPIAPTAQSPGTPVPGVLPREATPPIEHESIAAVSPEVAASQHDAAPADLALTPATPAAPVKQPISLWTWIAIAWCAGAALALLLLLLGYFSLRRLTQSPGHRGTPVPGVLQLRDPLRTEMNITTRVRLLQSPTCTMPLAFGLLRPTILLPQALPETQTRAVLLHELAHIKRRDCLTQLLARIACAAYWFNPLLWHSAWRMRIERERACDDLVLQAGSPPADYAEQLLRIATGTRGHRMAAFAGIAMARKSTLEGRLLAILDETRNRKTLTRFAVPVAMLRAQDSKPPYIATLSNGVTVELIGVSTNPSVGQPWWKPDGQALAEDPYEKMNGTVNPGPNEMAREFAIRLDPPPEESVDVQWRFDPPGSGAGFGAPQKGGQYVEHLRAGAQTLPGDVSHVRLRIGIAAGPWQNLSTHTGRSHLGQSRDRHIFAWTEALAKEYSTVVTLTHNIQDKTVRIIAIDNTGASHSRARVHHTGFGQTHQLTAQFKGISPADVKEFRFQSRPYEWIEFHNVSLKPGHRTQVEIAVVPANQSPAPRAQNNGYGHVRSMTLDSTVHIWDLDRHREASPPVWFSEGHRGEQFNLYAWLVHRPR